MSQANRIEHMQAAVMANEKSYEAHFNDRLPKTTRSVLREAITGRT